ncbi:rhodanese-like domain-containing protein [Ekhidna sp.]|uniref:rhodanese-like domain-containing protein n=1 Tax=Ekhidna sp. TaxID=2608089 RepID=UPI00329A7B2E
MKYQNINAEAFAELRTKENHVVLDVRTPGELAEGSIPGYTMVNFFDPNFREEVARLDKTKTYLIYCRSGNRSGQACALMANMGFETLYNLQGGIGAWNEAVSIS